MREIDHPPLGEILEPTRGGDEDVGALRAVSLCAERHAAVGRRDREALGFRERLQLRRHLRGELTGRDEHERRDAPVARDGPLRDRNRERERLARACGRLGEDVEPRQRVGQDKLLDSEGRVDRAGGERVDDARGHAELAKRML